MIRFAWLQARIQVAVGMVGLLIVAVVAALTGPHLVHLYDTIVAPCGDHGDCPSVSTSFVNNDHLLQGVLNSVVLIVPLLIGIFWGAPLVARELEGGTFRLAWTQSVTRTHWLALKLIVVGLSGMVVAGLLSLAVNWWSSPFDRVNGNRFTDAVFGERGITPIGYAALAFALGVAVGVVVRRTLPAMGATLVAFVAARFAISLWIRPHLVAPLHQDAPLSLATTGFGSSNGGPFTLTPNPPDIPNAWIYSSQIVDKAGQAPTAQFLARVCPALGQNQGGAPRGSGQAVRVQAPPGAQATLANCLSKVGARFHEVVTFQPASRYWEFQWYETAICLGLAVVLSGFCIWWVRHRLN